MRRVLIFTMLGLMIAILSRPGGIWAGAPAQTSGISIIVEPSTELQQGKTGLVHVYGPGIQEVRAAFLGTTIDFYPTSPGDWIGFLAVGMEAERGGQMLDLTVLTEGNQVPTQISQEITITWGTFDYQPVELPYNLEPLLDPTLNAQDFDTLARVYDRISPERLFTTFAQPVPGPPISFFGGIRDYNNGVLRGRHTGVDYRAITGTPVGAASEGRVVFAAYLPIHGNHIVVDHGWGILSGYSHLSEILVVPGQLVRQGDSVGLTGATGRVQGPHVHFEIAVNGFWVDPVQFLDLKIPLAAPRLVLSNS